MMMMMMARVSALLVFIVLLTETLSSTGTEQASSCPPRWLLVGQRCLAFYPVWSSWSSAKSMCSQTGGNLASLQAPEERQLVRQLASTAGTPVWLGGYQEQQNGTWSWSDDAPFRINDWTNQRKEKTTEGGACMQMDPKSGELHAAPCGDLSFYICSTTASSEVLQDNKKPVGPGVVANVSLFDVVWGYSDLLPGEILSSSTFLQELLSGHLTLRCYTSFLQQEALYLQRVSGTLAALVNSLQEADDMRSLLLDTVKHYSSRNQSLGNLPPPRWLQSSLRSFHSVVLEEPVYWLVALSARAVLRDVLAQEQLRTGSPLVSESEVLYQDWREESLKEAAWIQRYRKVLEEHQDHMDVFKAVNIFRQHMMNQKSFYKSVVCDVSDDIL